VVAPEPLTPRARVGDKQLAVLTADAVLLASPRQRRCPPLDGLAREPRDAADAGHHLPTGFEQFVREAGDPARERVLPPPSELDIPKLVALSATYGAEFVDAGGA